MRYDVLLERRRAARVAIGVPTYSGARRVQWLLQSLHTARTQLEDVAITILDDGPEHANQLDALAVRYHANLLRHRVNEGVTRSWNDIVRFVDADISVLLNDDLVLTPGWLEHLVYFLEQNECGTVSPDLWFCEEVDVPGLLTGQRMAPREQGTRVRNPALALVDPRTEPKICIAALGCAFAFWRKNFDAVGGFNEATRQTHNESWLGTDMAARLRLPSYILPDRVWHVGSATFKENPSMNDRGDREAFIKHWGAYFEVTSPRHMRGMPPRTVRWLDANGEKREHEFHMRWWD